MSKTFRFCRFCLWVFLSAGASIAAAQSTTQPSDDTNQQISELRQEVAQLRDQVQSGSANPQSANAQTREGDLFDLHAGWSPDRGFIISSADDSFLLHPWAFIQVRDATNYVSKSLATDGHNTDNGFELPRMKFILDGNIFTKDLTYQFIWASADTTGSLGLQDAWARYHIPGTPLAIEGGQIRDPVDHEQYLFATKTMTPDRSIVNNILLNGDDIVKGLELSWGYDQDMGWRDLFAVTSGQRNFDTDFEDYPVNSANWGVADRFECKLSGTWNEYTQFTSLGDKQSLLVLGGGVDYTEAGAAGALTHVADIQYNHPDGFGVYAAYLGRYTRDNAGPPTTNGQATTGGAPRSDTYDTTARFMAAQLFDQHFEPFFRYEYIQFDPKEVTPGLNSNVDDFTLGANYYFYGHRAKISGAASYLPNGSPVSNTISDLFATHRGSELIVQVQFQLMI